MPADEIAALLAFARKRGLWLIADEVYDRLVYGNRAAPSFLDQSPRPRTALIVVNSFSKAWAMTGWRLGWMTLPPALLPEIEKLVEFNTSGAPTFLQRGGDRRDPRGRGFRREVRRALPRRARCRRRRAAACRRVAVARPGGRLLRVPARRRA